MRHSFAVLTIPPYGGIMINEPPNTWGDVKRGLSMNRYLHLFMIAFVAIVGFLTMAALAKSGYHSYTELGVVGQVYVYGGFLLILASFIAVSQGLLKTASERTIGDHVTNYGIIMAAFGFAITPFTKDQHHQVNELIQFLTVGLLALGIATLVRNRHTSDDMSLRAEPVFVAMLLGAGSVWALAAGWNFWLSAGVLFIGLAWAFRSALLRPANEPVASTVSPQTVGVDVTV